MKPKTIDMIAEEESLTDMDAQYKRVTMNRSILIGVEHHGIDFAMFNYILHKHDFKKANTALDYVRQFWKYFFPHFKNFRQDWALLQQTCYDLQKEHDELLKKYAEADYDKKLAEEFIETRYQEEFEEWEKFTREKLQEESKA